MNERWLPYCCEVFDHDWQPQRLIKGAECEMELFETISHSKQRRWRLRVGENRAIVTSESKAQSAEAETNGNDTTPKAGNAA